VVDSVRRQPDPHPDHEAGPTPPAWWARLPRPAAVVVGRARPSSVYQVAAVRREARRLALLMEHLSPTVHDDMQAAIRSLTRAAAQLLDELEAER
jgi:uncharacterized protein YgbK (DUF1537 family)